MTRNVRPPRGFYAIWKSEVLNDVGSLLDLCVIWSLWVGEDLLGWDRTVRADVAVVGLILEIGDKMF